ncbi:MAG: ZIP family metal transporter [Candidatus Micrarchaeota archaeon]
MAFFDLLSASVLAMLATALGSLLVVFAHRSKMQVYAKMLGFSAGVMSFTAAELFLQSAPLAGVPAIAAGFALGVAAIVVLEISLPHAHRLLSKEELGHSRKKAFLLAGAVTLHNIPEGFSIASAFSLSPALGWIVAVSISVQDVVEGFAVAAPLAFYGLGLRKGVAIGIFSGVVELAAAIAGYFALSYAYSVVPMALAFSSGCMVFVVLKEMLPDALERAGVWVTLASFLLGVAVAGGVALFLGF